MRSFTWLALILALPGLAFPPVAQAWQEEALCDPAGGAEQEEYVRQNLDRAGLQADLTRLEEEAGVLIEPSTRRALLIEYLCEEHRQTRQRTRATAEDVRSTGQKALASYFAALAGDKDKVLSISGQFSLQFNESGWRFPKPRKYVILTVAAKPSEARIEVNGSPLPATRKMLAVPGRYQVRASHPGYQTWQKDVRVEAGKNLLVQCKLAPSPHP